MVSDAAAVGQGSLVEMDGGVVVVAASSSTAIIGVSAYFVSSAKPVAGDPHFGTALYGTGTLRKAVMVYDDPEEIFVVQSDGAMAVGGLTSYVGGYFTFVAGDTVNSTNGQSQGELDATGTDRYKKAPALLNQLWCVGQADEVRSDDYDASFCNLLVKINPNMHMHANKITAT
jgi:hypothetical protein